MFDALSHWKYFNFQNIMQEATARLAENRTSTAQAVTPDMRSREYWIAHCAHNNAAVCIQEEQDHYAAIKRWYKARYSFPGHGADMDVRCAHSRELDEAEHALCNILKPEDRS